MLDFLFTLNKEIQSIASSQHIIVTSFRTVRTRQRLTQIVLQEDLRVDHTVAFISRSPYA